MVLTKEEALEMFKQNPFKVQLIKAKIAEGGKTTAYRCGNLIDLCTGPHVQTTQKIKAMQVLFKRLNSRSPRVPVPTGWGRKKMMPCNGCTASRSQAPKK